MVLLLSSKALPGGLRQIGKGLRFLQLPLPPDKQRPNGLMNAPRILIVDDDLTLLQVLPETLQLRMDGVVVDTCDSARAALERIASTEYDAIVCDIKMPGMDGLALLAEIRVRRPNLPTLLMTAHDEYQALQALRGGACDFIQKPIDRDYFVASLTRAIGMRQLGRQIEQQQVLVHRANELEKIVEERTHKLREANRIKDEFLAILSHELRTPLTSVLAWTKLLRTGKLDDATFDRALEMIDRNARAQARLIEDLLDISRIIAGKLPLDIRPVELVSVIKTAVETMRPEADAKSIRLQMMVGTEGKIVAGDSFRLQQIILNLLSNAIKFTPKGGEVVVRLMYMDSQARITLSDTGRGISAEFLPYVFERFRQADGSTTRAQGGLGLGLAIVRHLVEMHGGTVQAESSGEGQGSRFTVNIPLTGTQDLTSSSLRQSEESVVHKSSPAILQDLRILIVDDDAETREVLTVMLKQFGAEVMAVASCREAIEVLTRMRPDVLLSDIALPDEDGYALIQKVRMLEPEQGGLTPAAALTAYAGIEAKTRALSSGFQVHVAKPVEAAHLAAVIADLCGRAGQHLSGKPTSLRCEKATVPGL
jgi:signal transduction histidine kinase